MSWQQQQKMAWKAFMKINLFPEEKNTQTSIRICAFKKLCVDKFSYIKKRARLELLIEGQNSLTQL